MSGERRRGIVCLHTRLTTAHDHCPDCGTSVTNVIVWTDQFAAARTVDSGKPSFTLSLDSE